MSFSNLLMTVLGCYIAYYIAIYAWDSLFKNKKQIEENRNIPFSLNKNHILEEEIEEVSSDDYIQEKKKVIQIPEVIQLPVEGQGRKVTSELIRELARKKSIFDELAHD